MLDAKGKHGLRETPWPGLQALDFLALAITWPQGALDEDDSLGEAAQVNAGVRGHGFAVFHALVSVQQSKTVWNKVLDVPRNARWFLSRK